MNQGLQKIYDVINWDNVGPYITYFVSAFTGAFNGLVDNLDWDLLGRVIGAGINTIVNTLNLLIEGIDWKNLGTKISVGMRGLINEVDWGNLGNLLGSKFMIQWDIFTGFVDDMWRKDDLTGLTGWSELGTHLAEGLNGIFEKIDLGKIGGTIGKAITGLFQSAIDFSKEFEWTSLGLNISNGINQFLENFDATTVAQGASDLVTGILDTLIKVIETTEWGMIGEKIADFIGAIDWGGIVSRLAELAGAIIGGIFATLWELIKEAWTNISNHFLSYIFESMAGLDEDASLWEIGWAIIQGMFNGIIDTIATIGKWIYDHILKPFIDGFKRAFGIHSPSTVMKEMGTFIMEGLLGGIKSLVDTVVQTIKDVWSGIKEVFEEFSTWLKGIFEKDWTESFGAIGEVLNVFFDTIGEVWDSIKDIFGGIIDFLTGVFTGDWEKAWDGVTKIFDGIAGVIGGIVDGIIGVIKTVIEAIQGAIQKIKEFFSESSKASATGPVGGAFSSISGMSSNSTNSARSVSGYSMADIPRLATGSVIRGGNPFMAILGDQPAGQVNVEAPLDTIKQAVREELSGMNFGSAGVGQAKVVLNINGVDVGEAMLDDLFSVMQRRGYDVSVLGVR